MGTTLAQPPRHMNPLRRMNNKLESFGRQSEWIVWALFLAGTICITVFHEPWFDEAQAWTIARDANLSDILFTIPHFEGHPPLWHLILLPFAKLGVSYEIGIKLVAILFSGMAAWLLVFKAPFPRIVRFIIPFTYFFFYQYTVVSRPYCLMMLALLLLAIAYKTRNHKPFRFILALLLLCATGAYGIVLSGGIALVWLGEIWRNREKTQPFMRTFLRSRRFAALLLLLLCALALVWMILPSPDAYGTHLEARNSFPVRLLFMLVYAPLDATCWQTSAMYDAISVQTFPTQAIFFGAILFVFGAIVLYAVGKSARKLSLLLLPYGLFAVFGAASYFYSHHIGIAALYLTFWFWVCLDQKDYKFAWPKWLQRRETAQFQKGLTCLAYLFLAFCCGVSLYWTVCAASADVTYAYSLGRESAAYIQEHNLTDGDIMHAWYGYSTDGLWEDDTRTITTVNADGITVIKSSKVPFVAHQDSPIINAYFPQGNIFCDNPNPNTDAGYIEHRLLSKEETLAYLQEWRTQGSPEALYGNCDLEAIFDDDVSLHSYVKTKVFTANFIWKDNLYYTYQPLYLRKDIARELWLAGDAT